MIEMDQVILQNMNGRDVSPKKCTLTKTAILVTDLKMGREM